MYSDVRLFKFNKQALEYAKVVNNEYVIEKLKNMDFESDGSDIITRCDNKINEAYQNNDIMQIKNLNHRCSLRVLQEIYFKSIKENNIEIFKILVENESLSIWNYDALILSKECSIVIYTLLKEHLEINENQATGLINLRTI